MDKSRMVTIYERLKEELNKYNVKVSLVYDPVYKSNTTIDLFLSTDEYDKIYIGYGYWNENYEQPDIRTFILRIYPELSEKVKDEYITRQDYMDIMEYSLDWNLDPPIHNLGTKKLNILLYGEIYHSIEVPIDIDLKRDVRLSLEIGESEN